MCELGDDASPLELRAAFVLRLINEGLGLPQVELVRAGFLLAELSKSILGTYSRAAPAR